MMYCSGLVLPPSTRKGSGRLLVPGKRQPKILCSARMPEWQELARAIHDRQPVAGLTHNFYKYPARFSPSFVRQAILNFTEPGDLGLDPFMGPGALIIP
jgi:DNA modification methylase